MMMRQPSSPMVLEQGTEFARGHRVAKVYRSSPNGCEVIWAESYDLETGEVIKAISDFIPADVIGRELSRGSIRIIKLPPTAETTAIETVQERPPTVAELERASHREGYIRTCERFINEGRMRGVRSDFVRNFRALLGETLADRALAKSNPKCGTVKKTLADPTCGDTLFRWWDRWEKAGKRLTIDRLRNCGRGFWSKYTDEEWQFYNEVVRSRLSGERPSIANILASVQAAVHCENERRLGLAVPEATLAVPSYDAVRQIIARIAPLDHKIRTRGMNAAYRDLHTLGLGLKVSRLLERVEIDEYTIDLMVFVRMLELHKVLAPEEATALGLDGTPQRLILSAAIDVYSGAIVGLQIARSGSVDVTLRTIEMIYLDKQPIADASGAEMPWPMHGHPQTLVLDRSSINMSDITYARLCIAGITNFAVPAGKPFLKPFIERFFALFGSLFLQRFTGRTFSNVVQKGENDPAARASVSLDEFLMWLTRWIVDVHHTQKSETMGKKAPLAAWTEAASISPPIVRADQNMLRAAFGVTLERKATREGVIVEGIRYQHEDIATWFLNETERNLTVVWWDKDIGMIDVFLPNGKCVTATCTDPEWYGKSYTDIVIQRRADEEEKRFGQSARSRAIVEIDNFTKQKAALRDLIPVTLAPQQLSERTKEFSRYMVTAERRDQVFGDVFDNVVQPPSQQVNASDSASGAQQSQSDAAFIQTRDIME